MKSRDRVSGLALGAWSLLLILLLVPLVVGKTGLAGSADSPGLDIGRSARLFSNSVYASGLAAVIAVIWALVPAFVASRSTRRQRLALASAAVYPLFVAPPVIAVAAITILGGGGYVSSLWDMFVAFYGQKAEGAVAMATAPVYTLTGLGLTLAWAYGSIAFVVLYAAFGRVDPAAEEAARLHASPARAFFSVTLPSVRPAVLLSLSLVFLLAMNEFGIPESLRVQPVLVSEVYTQFGVYYNGRAAALVAVILVALSLALLAGIQCVARLNDQVEELEPLVDAGEPGPGMGRRVPYIARVAAWVLVLLPSLGLLAILVLKTNGPDGFFAVVGKTWAYYHREFGLTLLLSAVASSCSILVGLVIGIILSGARRPRPLRFVLLAGFLIPGPIIGMSFKMMMLLPPGSLPLGVDDAMASLDSTYLPLLLAHVVRFAPLCALLTEFQLRRVPGDLVDAARLESRPGFPRFWTWGGPSVTTSATASFLAIAALVVGEMGATVLLVPPGTAPLSVTLMTLMHYAPTSDVGAISLLLSLPSILLLPFFALLAALYSLGTVRRNS